MAATLSVDKQGHLATVRLTRPEAGNPIDRVFLRDLEDACAALNDDAEVRVVIVTAEGDVFSIGWGQDELSPDGFDAIEWRQRFEVGPPFACLEELGQPVVCAINGDAVSAGLELALACDVRIAAQGARFALPETALGMVPMAGGTQRLARIVGRGEALRMVLLAESIDAEEARRIGLVGAVVPGERLLADAQALAERIASRGPVAVRYAKEAVRRGLDLPLDQALRYETDLTVILQTTDDRAEGVRAFLEKRRPEFKGG
jgi:enoyl-CoA hydratase